MATCSVCGTQTSVGDHGLCVYLESAGAEVVEAFRALSQDERAWVNRILAESLRDGRSELLGQLFADYVHVPPTIEQFIDDPYYIGQDRRLWPKQRAILREIYSQDIFEVVLTGGIGWGKTTLAEIILLYELAKLLCLRNPRDYYGLREGRPIVIGLFNLTFEHAYNINYVPLRTQARRSPFFQRFLQEEGRADKYVRIRGDVVRIALGSAAIHALGADMFGGMIDEANFRAPSKPVNEVAETYVAISRRIKERFMQAGGLVPGKMVLVSSKSYSTSFLEEHIESLRGSPGVYIADYPIYRVKPPEHYCGKKFRVAVGDRYTRPRILEDGEAADGRVEEVPVEYIEDFRRDIDAALRDICGIRTMPFAPLFPRLDIVLAGLNHERKHPFSVDTIEVSLDTAESLTDYLLVPELAVPSPVRDGKYEPKYHPREPRFVHVDLSKNSDATGICVGCSGGVKKLTVPIGETEEVVQTLPTIHIDFVLRVKAARGSEIDQAKIRHLILYLRNHLGFPIAYASADQYQSVHLLQDLRRAGIRVQVFSVDRDDLAYLTTREALMQARVDLYPYAPLVEEWKHLVRNVDKRKVDHDGDGAKDVSDALAAVIAQVLVPDLRAKRESRDKQVAPRLDPAMAPVLQPSVPVQSESWGWVLEDYRP